ncbi:hypothetical protein OS175_15155 [Marinicella sp. S1101]|uniref:hypothetical protein n=1 Tax=Marinicella marina TaxID=2996016 RepID=UPI002260AAA0|nr:hypothetical protein [Marinicella marina]MCX7555208.1 hypothetical protein [Marinicella marina]MDJ1141610.1 hypothetical protein [Marinicella marina]
MKIKLLFISLMIFVFYFGWSLIKDDAPDQPTVSDSEQLTLSNQDINEQSLADKLREKSLTQLNVPEGLKSVAEELLPISTEELSMAWEEEYGCYVFGSEGLDAESDLLSNECNHALLTAHSFEEAQWMQRQGYPKKSNLDKLNNSDFREKLRQLANQNYTPAIALLAIYEMQSGNTEIALDLSSTLAAYSDRHLTFPHRLNGEALIANNMTDLGVIDLQVASLLGDTEAGYLAHRYIGNNTVLAMSTVNNAHLRMSRYFKLPFEEYPFDPRPDPSSG